MQTLHISCVFDLLLNTNIVRRKAFFFGHMGHFKSSSGNFALKQYNTCKSN